MNMTPRQIIEELDKYIIGQKDAKRAVAIALRNRYRRSMLPDSVREEITPKNIIMKGPTGVGKTEISRRLAKLVKAPFVKVEATKFTEVGYVGRDVESMIRDLAEVSLRLVKEERMQGVAAKARTAAEERVADIILGGKKKSDANEQDKADVLGKLRSGQLDSMEISIEVAVKPKPLDLSQGMGMEINIGDIMSSMGGPFGRSKTRMLKVKDVLNRFTEEESEKLLDIESVNEEAIRRAENEGIIFIDEIDKIASRSGTQNGPDVSREGVQRDILPIVEGSTVNTKYGAIKTDFILFIASGAFHVSRVEDLIPELQGRFPIFVELDSLKHDDFVRILTETENSITFQYASLLAVDNIKLSFTKDAIDEIALIAAHENESSENIGARRLHTIMEALLEDISFNACGGHADVDVVIDRAYVEKHLSKTIKKHDLKKYIL